MARPTFADAFRLAQNDATMLLAMLVSMQQPDGTPITGESVGEVTIAAPDPLTATSIGTVTANAAGVAATSGLRFFGFSAAENAVTAAAAEFILRHGDDAADPILLPVTLSADESTSDVLPEPGIACPNGIYVDHVGGSFSLVLYTKVVS